MFESHTPYEWKVQRALMIVDPWGDERADMRAAYNTLATSPVADEDGEMLAALLGYLKINERDTNAGPADMRRAMETIP